jgi:hypothetical protein
MQELQEHIVSGEVFTMENFTIRRPARHIVCADGLILSVQASESHYCEPRSNEGPYTHVEVGFPSSRQPVLLPYAENPDDPTGTVYAYVPTQVVLDVINEHGGMIETIDSSRVRD